MDSKCEQCGRVFEFTGGFPRYCPGCEDYLAFQAEYPDNAPADPPTKPACVGAVYAAQASVAPVHLTYLPSVAAVATWRA